MGIISVWGAALDKDNCLYKNPANYPQLFDETAAHALVKLLDKTPDDIKFQKLVSDAQRSYRETGSPVRQFADQYDIPFELLEAERHRLMPHQSIVPIPGLPAAMNRAIKKRGQQFNLTTHCHPNLGNRTIPHMGLDKIFNEESNVITLDVVGYDRMKHEDPAMVIRASKNMGIGLDEMAFFEDSARNFIPIKDHDSRVQTVLITWGRDVQKTAGIDHIFRDPLEAVNAMHPPERKTMVFAKSLR